MRDVEGLAKTNGNDIIDKSETKHWSCKHTHVLISVLTAVHGKWTELQRREGCP